MPQTPGVFSKSKQAGKLQRNPPRPVLCHRVQLEGDPDEQAFMWWNEDGELFADPEFTKPLGLTIVKLAE